MKESPQAIGLGWSVLDSSFWNAFLASDVACLLTFLGIYCIITVDQWARQKMGYFLSFAAGTLIAISFLHIIPTAMEMTHQAPIYILAGYFSIYFIDRFMSAYVCEEDEQSYDCDDHDHVHAAPRQQELGLIPMVGIGFHSLIDGMIYTITFHVSLLTGLLAFVGLVLHEFPEGVITYLLLVHSGVAKNRAIWISALVAGVTTPVGMLISYPAVFKLSGPTLGAMLAVSGGMLVYVGASHLLPETQKHNSRYSILALGAGILIAILLMFLEPGGA
jgi:zinc and cadmium transporter